MPISVDPKQQAVRDEVKGFAEKNVYPESEKWDRMPEPREFPRETYRKTGEAGFIGYAMPPDLRGKGKTHRDQRVLVIAGNVIGR